MHGLGAFNGVALSDASSLVPVLRADAHDVAEALRDNQPPDQWPDELQQRYAKEQESRILSDHRFLFMLGLIVAFGTTALDATLYQPMALEGLLLRIAIIVPVTAFGLFAANRRWTKSVAACLAAGPAAFILIMCHLAMRLPQEHSVLYLSGAVLVMATSIISLPFSFRGLTVFGGIVAVLSVCVLLLHDPNALSARIYFIVVVTLALSTTLALAARIDSLNQRNFLLQARWQIRSRDLMKANHQLQKLSRADPLTGLANRRGFERAFDESFTHDSAGTEGEAVALMMIDLDNFKTFNDVYGHQAGDDCLVHTASKLDTIFEEADGMVARYGGDEFIAVLREEFEGQAEEVAERARAALSSMVLTHGLEGGAEETSRLTASIGIGVVSAASSMQRHQLIALADKALYEAKRAGRDQIQVLHDQPAI